jgi:hypothetical protein
MQNIMSRTLMEAQMKPFAITVTTLMLLVACVALLPCEAGAQKKKAPPKADQMTEQPASTTTSPSTKMGGTVRDVLTKFKGQKTNLGMLSKVEAEYFTVEDDGVSIVHPYSAVIGIKLLKIEEGEEDAVKIEIQLMR